MKQIKQWIKKNIKYCMCSPACHVNINQNQRIVKMQKRS